MRFFILDSMIDCSGKEDAAPHSHFIRHLYYYLCCIFMSSFLVASIEDDVIDDSHLFFIAEFDCLMSPISTS
ncbi:hypothetical protein PRIPAC_88620 [Pristionchus pacificus]|uniref:Uncharacterized protein n=1 Tax=Pristionchus pacificus TaxID=54126 RepID=A0A2A6B6C8_PRIPA|nr:hypothetical protein PRIPAC_88620 [Pristionchus pacificus]|eukprot:PDM61418.1 hypothetical protein PRIPAC_50860 [Pristionchus pacificus]